MSTEENKAIVRRLVDVWNTGEVEMLDELAAPHHVEHWRSRARQTESGPEWTIEEWADQVREMRRSVTRRAEEARQLMVE